MVGDKHKNRSNRNQGYLASSEPNSPTIASARYTITPEKQDMNLKSLLMMMMEDYKKDTNNSLKEIQEDTFKQVKELNKTIQNLKMEVESIKKSQRETTLEIENRGKKSGAIDASITNRIQGIEEIISGIEDTIENIDKTIKENVKCKKLLTQNIQEIQDIMRRPKIIDIDEKEDFQLKGPVNIFNKIIEENYPNLKKEMPMNIQEA
jgi:septal ring factor EnvC (AmiA/AmiB activator)